MQKFVPRSRVGIFRNERTRSTPLDPKMMFWCVLYHLGAFGAVCRVGIFCNEGTRSTPFDPKLIFWCISYHLGAFGAVWLPYETRCKTGRTSANVRAMKLRRNFLQRTHPILPIRPLTDVLVRFVPFGCIRDLLVALQNSVQNGPN